MAATTLWQSGQYILPLQNGYLRDYDNGAAEGGAIQVAVGTFVANSGTAVTVAAPSVTASSQIKITLKTPGGTPAAPFLTTVTPGTGFTVNSGASDTSTYNYAVIG